MTAAQASDVTDLDLVRLAQAGDVDAFGELVERNRRAVFRAALAAVGSPSEAEDVAQEAFVTAWRKLGGFRGESQFRTWLLSITWRKAIDRRKSVTATLSGGMRTRLSLACTLVHRPRLLLLDEPTVGVDPQLRAQLWTGLRQMAADGATILVSSHVMDEAERADRLGLIRDGRILAEGTVAELLATAGTDRLEDAFLRLSGGPTDR